MSRFEFLDTQIEDLKVITPKPIVDDRGFFERFFCKEDFKDAGLDVEIAQINRTLTKAKGSIRGMHYQLPPFSEAKVVRCLRGAIFDVAVDIRRGSKTFLQWHGEVLSEDNGKYMYIPKGFAHGFETLTDNVELFYLHTNMYSKEHEMAIRFDDPKLCISWPLEIKHISQKDANHPLLDNNFTGVAI